MMRASCEMATGQCSKAVVATLILELFRKCAIYQALSFAFLASSDGLMSIYVSQVLAAGRSTHVRLLPL